MPLNWEEIDFSSTQDLEISDDEPWPINSNLIPISTQASHIEIAEGTDPSVLLKGLGYYHKGIARLNAQTIADPSLMDERRRLRDEVCVPIGTMNNVCVTNFETARAYLREGQNQVGGNWPKVRYVISIMDPPPADPSKPNLWNDLVPKDENEFPKDNLLHISMADNRNACAIEFFPEICKFIHQANQKREGSDDCILVHCRKGMSRSVAAVMAYLIWSQHYSVDEALDRVLATRMVALPNSGFHKQLTWWAEMDCNLYNFRDGFSEEPRMNPLYLTYRQEKNLRIYGRQPNTRALNGISRPKPWWSRRHDKT